MLLPFSCYVVWCNCSLDEGVVTMYLSFNVRGLITIVYTLYGTRISKLTS